LPTDSNYILTGSFNVLSGFTDPNAANNLVNFSTTPIVIQSNDLGYFTFSPFRASQLSGSARSRTFAETGTVTIYPGGSQPYSYTDTDGIGFLQIIGTSSDDQFAFFELSIPHHAPPRLNGKTITMMVSSLGASGSGSLVEEGLIVPGISFTQQVAYYKLT
jgi:hypothetical protein